MNTKNHAVTTDYSFVFRSKAAVRTAELLEEAAQTWMIVADEPNSARMGPLHRHSLVKAAELLEASAKIRLRIAYGPFPERGRASMNAVHRQNGSNGHVKDAVSQ